MDARELTSLYNRIEPFIWYAVAVLSVPALRRHAPLRDRLIVAGLPAAFGTSDFFEHSAWWTPWWLPAWKATSLILLVTMMIRIRRRSRRGFDVGRRGPHTETPIPQSGFRED